MSRQYQGPLGDRKIAEGTSRLRIVRHPAVRIGFLDAMNGRAFDHDDIIGRIRAETPANALKRWDDGFLNENDIEIAQYRYEEGRLMVIKYGLRCKSWDHPDFPPKSVLNFAKHRPDNEPL